MKKAFLLLLIFIFKISNSQFKSRDKVENLINFDDQQFSWGYYLGVNYFDMKLHPDSTGMDANGEYLVDVKPQMGFTVGLIGRWRIADFLDFRFEPGIHFLQRDFLFKNIDILIDETAPGSTSIYTSSDTKIEVKSTYLDLPLFINIHGNRWNNTRPYFQTGVSWLINLQSNEKKIEDSKDGKLRLKSNNFSYQLEGGIEIYFKRFKLTPSVKGIFFFNSEWVPDNKSTPPVWAGTQKSISTRALVFSLKFE